MENINMDRENNTGRGGAMKFRVSAWEEDAILRQMEAEGAVAFSGWARSKLASPIGPPGGHQDLRDACAKLGELARAARSLAAMGPQTNEAMSIACETLLEAASLMKRELTLALRRWK
jgi:hypothetical protein